MGETEIKPAELRRLGRPLNSRHNRALKCL